MNQNGNRADTRNEIARRMVGIAKRVLKIKGVVIFPSLQCFEMSKGVNPFDTLHAPAQHNACTWERPQNYITLTREIKMNSLFCNSNSETTPTCRAQCARAVLPAEMR